jgi:hypothetical protein
LGKLFYPAEGGRDKKIYPNRRLDLYTPGRILKLCFFFYVFLPKNLSAILPVTPFSCESVGKRSGCAGTTLFKYGGTWPAYSERREQCRFRIAAPFSPLQTLCSGKKGGPMARPE